MALISLLVLVAAIVLAFLCKVNTGLVAITASLILGRFFGLSDKWLLGAFDSSLFLMLFGVMYLFCIAQENKTLELLAKKILALSRGRVKLFPLLLFVLSAVLSAIGPGLISVTALMAALIVALAKEADTHPMRLLPFGTLGAFAGGLSPITPSGIVAITKANEAGIPGLDLPLSVMMIITTGLYSLILYFFVFKWHKHKTVKPAEAVQSQIPKFTVHQLLTLGGIIVTALLTAIFKINVGLAAFAVSVVLTVVGAANEGAALKKLPWGTLVMITGVGILISVVTELGGIDLLSSALSKLMGEKTATAIITVLAGVMSWFSSASGVVMPTLIPTVPTIAQGLQSVTPLSLTIGVCIGAHLAALSPLSSCGGLMLAAYSSDSSVDAKARNKAFGQLFAMSACGVAFGGLLGLLGLYGISF